MVPGKNAPARSAYIHPNEPISTRNYPKPHYGNTYITNNTTVINNNYRYDSSHYAPHVANFYGYNDPVWGGHWRYGCFSPPGGVSVSFSFGNYAYTPFYAPVVASPWYYYPTVPAYFPQDQVVVLSNYSCGWNSGTDYVYTSGDDPEFNTCVSYFSGFYVNANFGNFSLILDDQAPISVFCEGNYEYTLPPSAFQATCEDTVHSCSTIGYDIIGVHRWWHAGYNDYFVYGRHRFRGPTGGTEVVYQQYHMHRGFNGHYVVTDFNTSHRPFRFR